MSDDTLNLTKGERFNFYTYIALHFGKVNQPCCESISWIRKASFVVTSPSSSTSAFLKPGSERGYFALLAAYWSTQTISDTDTLPLPSASPFTPEDAAVVVVFVSLTVSLEEVAVVVPVTSPEDVVS